jgi:hypothetical protein
MDAAKEVKVCQCIGARLIAGRLVLGRFMCQLGWPQGDQVKYFMSVSVRVFLNEITFKLLNLVKWSRIQCHCLSPGTLRV